MNRRILVTGGAGFIGSNFIRLLLEREPNTEITNLDALTYAGVGATVDELNTYQRHAFVHGDIRDADLVERIMEGHHIVVHFAAESHVDRSISGPAVFLETNVVGTGVLIDAARRHGVRRFIHVSTDEVYGSLADGYALETDRLAPSSPYSASKAASDLLALSYAHTFGFPVLVTRCTNNYGPYQFPEKVIPLFITNLLDGLTIPLYGNGLNQRDWIHVLDHCEALLMLLDDGEPGEVYNIGSNAQLSNLDLTNRILSLVGRGKDMIEPVPDRPGHDFRYAVDSSKIRALGWAPAQAFDQRLAETVEWYTARRDWWEPLKQAR
jgi:dTDP-glucose 4,6-dehydratase